MKDTKQSNPTSLWSEEIKYLLIAVVIIFTLGIFGTSHGQSLTEDTFANATLSVGITPDTGDILSVSWVDYNHDGWVDLWLGNHFGYGGHKPFLYINQGSGTFTNIIDLVWSADPRVDTHGAAWTDFDNDGDSDLLELVGAGRGFGQVGNQFFVNEDGILVERAEEFGLSYSLGQGRMGSWFDWDSDGWLDAIVTSPPSRPDDQKAPTTIFRQIQDGMFENVGDEAGVSISKNGQVVQVADMTGDGILDLVIQAVSETPHRIYAGGERPYVDWASVLFPQKHNYVQDFTIADFNGDLYPDMYVLRRKLGAEAQQINSTMIVAQLVGNRRLTVKTPASLLIQDNRALGDGDILSALPIFIGASGMPLGDGMVSLLVRSHQSRRHRV